jgi:hypothetical protein
LRGKEKAYMTLLRGRDNATYQWSKPESAQLTLIPYFPGPWRSRFYHVYESMGLTSRNVYESMCLTSRNVYESMGLTSRPPFVSLPALSLPFILLWRRAVSGT